MSNKFIPGTLVKCNEEENILIIKNVDKLNKKIYCKYAASNSDKNMGQTLMFNMDDVKVISAKGETIKPIRITFFDPEYTIEDKTVKCVLNYQLHIEDLLSNGITLTNKIINATFNNNINGFNKDNWIQTIKKFNPSNVFSFIDSNFFPKYGKAGVAYYDEAKNKYYEWCSNSYKELLVENKGEQKIYYKHVTIRGNKYNTFSTVTSIAKCHNDDKFNERLGKNIALAKAKKNVYKIVKNITNDIYTHYDSIMSNLFLLLKSMEYNIARQQNFINKQK